MALDPLFLARPIAHRGFHGADGLPENSPAAFQAALDLNYGIELDLQLSGDGQAMVFHDPTLERLTDNIGRVSEISAAELGRIRLAGGSDNIPQFRDVLAQIDGRVPLLIEMKDQSGVFGPMSGALEAAIVAALADYSGPVAVMSYNPYAMAEVHRLNPDLSVGLTTGRFSAVDWPDVPEAHRLALARLEFLDMASATFISHDQRDLKRADLAALRKDGMTVLCWTIRSAKQEAEARKYADNITFEGYPA